MPRSRPDYAADLQSQTDAIQSGIDALHTLVRQRLDDKSAEIEVGIRKITRAVKGRLTAATKQIDKLVMPLAEIVMELQPGVTAENNANITPESPVILSQLPGIDTAPVNGDGGGPPIDPPPPPCPPGTHGSFGVCVPDTPPGGGPPDEGPPVPPSPPGGPPGQCVPGEVGCLPCGPVTPIPPPDGCPIGTLPPIDRIGPVLGMPTEVWGPPGGLSGNAADPGIAIYSGQVPSYAPGIRLAGPQPLHELLTQLGPMVPRGPFPPIHVPDGPPVPPGTPCLPPVQPGCPPCVPPVPPEPPPELKECQPLYLRDLPEFDPGSKDFCTHVEQYKQAFTKLGLEVANIIHDGSLLVQTIGHLEGKLKLVPIVGEFLAFIVTSISSQWILLDKFWCRVEDFLTGTLHNRAGVVYGLWFAKSLFQEFSSVTTGIDLFLEFENEYSVELNQLLRIIDYLIEHEWPIEIPIPGEVIELYNQKLVNRDTAVCWSRMHGVSDSIFDLTADARREKLTTDDVVRLWRRRSRDVSELKDTLRGYGWTRTSEVDNLAELAFETPTPSDLLGFARREVFRKDKLGVEEMAKEFEGEIGLKELFAAGGIGPVTIKADAGNPNDLPVFMKDNGDGTITYDVPLAHWFEHYQEISPTQGFEMVHRLRVDRVDRFKTFIPGTTADVIEKLMPGADIKDDPDNGGVWVTPQPWTSFELAKLLRQLEYNPIERARLEAISYRVIGRIDIRRIYFAGGFGAAMGRRGFSRDNDNRPIPNGPAEIEVAERFMDLGFTREDSNVEAYQYAYLYEIQYTGDPVKLQVQGVCESYSQGAMSAEDAIADIEDLLGDRTLAARFVARCDFKLRVADIKATVRAIKKLFMRGEASRDETETMLLQAGVTQRRTDQLLRVWAVERRGNSKQATAEKMCSWYKMGLITIQDMRERLDRLGWHDEDSDRIVAHCVMGQLAQDAKELDKRTKAEAKQIEKLKKEQDRLAKQRASEAEKALKKLMALDTEANLKAEWKAGNLTAADIIRIFQIKGVNPGDIIRWLKTYNPVVPNQ